MDYVSIGSDNGLSPVWHQAIIWNNAAHFETIFSEILNIKFFIHENTFENVACKMVDILSRGR